MVGASFFGVHMQRATENTRSQQMKKCVAWFRICNCACSSTFQHIVFSSKFVEFVDAYLSRFVAIQDRFVAIQVLSYFLNLRYDTVRRNDHRGHMHEWKHCSNVNDAVRRVVPGPERQNLSGPQYLHLQDQAVRRFGDNEKWSSGQTT